MNVPTFDTYDQGQNVYVNSGQRTLYSDTGPTAPAPLDPLILPELALAVQQLDTMATTIPVDAPWTAKNAGTWDTQTLDTWIHANSLTERFRKLIPVATRPIFGAEPHELSLLFVVFYIASLGNEQNVGTFERNFDTRGGGQQSRFVGGSQLIPIKMAKQLGRRVVLSSPVRRIVQNSGGVRVESDRMTVRAKHVIVAIPPTLAGRIDYGEALRAPVDRIHWAGTETANYWNGYMDGAVRSGERAASEVLARL